MRANNLCELLRPKKMGLTGKNKPITLIVNDHLEKEDAATNFESTANFLSTSGYSVTNKKAINALMHSEEIKRRLKLHRLNKKEVTLYFSAHGSPGILFGEQLSISSELEGVYLFTTFILRLEQILKIRVTNIILSACYSAVELYNKNNGHYLFSPARMLSAMLPNRTVLGFLGEYNSVRVTNIYDKGLNTLSLSPEDSSVSFKSALATHLPEKINFYCSTKYLKPQIRKVIGFSLEVKYFSPYLREMLPKYRLSSSNNSVGIYQSKKIRQLKKKLRLEQQNMTEESLF